MSEANIDPDTGLPVLVKRPGDDRLFSMLFTNLLVGTAVESITSVTSTNQNKVSGSTNVTVDSGTVAGDAVEVRISGGTAGENYEIVAEVVDADQNTLVGKGALYVRDN